MRRPPHFAAAALAFLFAVGCGGGNSTGTGTTPNPTIALALTPTSGTVAQGGSLAVTGTVTRSTGYSGAITVMVTGGPTDGSVTGTAGAVTTNGDVSTAMVTLQIGATAAPGTYPLTVHANGPNVTEATATYTLTVTQNSSYSIGLAPAAVTVMQGNSGTSQVTINRSGYTGAVTLSLAGAPAGVSAQFAPPAPTGTAGTTSTLTLTVASTAAAGTYTLTVHGAVSGVPDQTATLMLTVTAASNSVAFTFDYSVCAAGASPLWLAVQDGSGAWAVVTPTNNVYHFQITQNRLGLAFVVDDGGGSDELEVDYYTRGEIAPSESFCAPAAMASTITGTINGLAAGEVASIFLGNSNWFATTNGALQFSVVPGVHDMLGYKQHVENQVGVNDRIFVSNGLTVSAGGSVGNLDVTTWSVPASAAMTLVGAGGGDQSAQTVFLTSSDCTTMAIYPDVFFSGTSSFTAYGVPEAQRASGQQHRVTVFTTSSAGSLVTLRQVTQTMGALAPTTFTLPAAVPTPTITTLSGSYARPLFTFAVPADYNGYVDVHYYSAVSSVILQTTIFASALYQAAAPVVWAAPDFGGLPGFNAAWQAAPGSPFNWTIFATNAGEVSLDEGLCPANTRALFGRLDGSM